MSSVVDTAWHPAHPQEVPRLWRDVGRWGHRMHSMCSYFAMFPPALANVMIQWLSEPGDVVYDPFSGRGTVPLEARRLGRVAVAADLNPLAVTLSRAKTARIGSERIVARLDELEMACRRAQPRLDAVPADISMLFSERALKQLLAIRKLLDVARDDDAFIAGALLGILHLNATRDGTPRGLTVSMPNTFAMSPAYVRRYIDEHGLRAPEVDVFDMLRRRVDVLAPDQVEGVQGLTLLRDATCESPPELKGRVKLLLTSPPYLSVIKYAKFNWIRLWFLGHEPKAIDAQLMASASLPKYVSFLCETLEAQAPSMRADGLACLVVGDVLRNEGNLRLAEIVADEIEARTDWRRLVVIADELPQDRKVSRIWGTRKGRATKTDRLLILRPPYGTARLPCIPEIDWTI